MDNDKKELKGRELTDEERKEMREGMALEEMDKTNPGWQIVKKWLENRAFHTWADPREVQSEKEWMFRELNSFWSATNAKELMVEIHRMIDKSRYLNGVASGEIVEKKMRI